MSNNRSGRAVTVTLYGIATVFLVMALALMTQWLTSDPFGEFWLLAGLLSVGGTALLIASVRGGRIDDDAGWNHRTDLADPRPDESGSGDRYRA